MAGGVSRHFEGKRNWAGCRVWVGGGGKAPVGGGGCCEGV